MFYQDKTIVVIGNIDFLSRTLFVLGCVIQKRSLAADSDGVLDLTLQYILSHYIFLRFRRISSKVWNEKKLHSKLPLSIALIKGGLLWREVGKVEEGFLLLCRVVSWADYNINWFRYLFFFVQTLTTTQPHHFYSLAGHCGPPAQLHWNLKTILLQWKLSALFIRKKIYTLYTLVTSKTALNIYYLKKCYTVDAQIFALLHF